MKIIDRYLLKNFTIFLTLSISLFIFIFLVVDISDNLGGYLQSGKNAKDIFLLYLFFIPSLITLLFPLGILVSIFFTIGLMIKNNELTAIKAAGISIYRFLLPLFLFLIFLSLLQFFFRESVETGATRRYREIKEGRDFANFNKEDFILTIDQFTLLKGEYFSSKKMFIKKPEVFKFDKNGNLNFYITANRGDFKNQMWIFEKCHIYDLDLNRYSYYETKEMVEFFVIFPDSMVFDRENVDIYKISELMSIRKKMIQARDDPSRQATEISYRFYFLLINLIIGIISASFVINTKDTGIVFALSLSILFIFFYWGILQSFKSAASNGFSNPFTIFFIPNFIFLLMSFFLLYKTRK